ncbi:MAG: BMC domain-containing protein [Lachnospiraceae bacterium]|nr:BMC domain-containing protein [Lachnospiraceae bacterium]
MRKAYGLIEITGVVAAMEALDRMCKAANVTLSTWERKIGGRLVTLIVEGDVADCKAAVQAARKAPIRDVVSYGVIASPHEEIVKLVNLSASRWKKPGNVNSDDRYLQEV